MIIVKLTFVRVDLLSNVEVDAQDDQVGNNVHSAYAHEDLWIIEGYLLRYLHHTKDDHQVGAAERTASVQLCDRSWTGLVCLRKVSGDWTYIWGLRPIMIAVEVQTAVLARALSLRLRGYMGWCGGSDV